MTHRLYIALAWMFGYIPRYLREDVESKQPGRRVCGFRRGSELCLEGEDPLLSFVSARELRGWIVTKDRSEYDEFWDRPAAAVFITEFVMFLREVARRIQRRRNDRRV